MSDKGKLKKQIISLITEDRIELYDVFDIYKRLKEQERSHELMTHGIVRPHCVACGDAIHGKFLNTHSNCNLHEYWCPQCVAEYELEVPEDDPEWDFADEDYLHEDEEDYEKHVRENYY